MISGAREEVLARCPSERIKFQSLGWAILITSGMAVVSMWFALASAMGFNPVLSFPVAVAWGLIIMGIDRWLVTSMPADGKRKLLIAAPRLALALLLGSLISTPIVLRIFESEINNQISIIKAQNEASFLNSTQHSSIQASITKWQKAVNNYQSIIDSKGAVQIDPAADPTIQDLNSQLSTAKSDASTDYKAWQCQLYGGCSSPKGNGPLANASHQRYLNDEQRISDLQGQVQAREQTLQANNTSSQSSRLQQASKALPGAQAQLTAAQAEENSLTNNFQGTNNSANGLLIRLKALDQLAAGSSTLQAARILLFLLFLVIEVLPVTVKLLQPKGNYEKILEQQVKQELAQADWEMRAGFEPAGMFSAPGDARPGRGDGGAGYATTRNIPYDRLDDELAKVWEQHLGADMGAGQGHDWEGRPQTEYLSSPDDDTTGPHRLDDILRSMPDTRSTGAYEERQGGTERRYGDDDL